MRGDRSPENRKDLAGKLKPIEKLKRQSRIGKEQPTLSLQLWLIAHKKGKSNLKRKSESRKLQMHSGGMEQQQWNRPLNAMRDTTQLPAISSGKSSWSEAIPGRGSIVSIWDSEKPQDSSNLELPVFMFL